MKLQFSKTISAAIVATALFLGSSAVFAQGKFGGPTPPTMDGNSIIHGEGTTANRNFKVNKASTQVTIQDGTQGDGNVFTSDANGNGSWQHVITSMTTATSNVSTAVTPANVPVKININVPTFDRGGNYNAATSVYTAPADGIYYIKGTVTTLKIAVDNQLFLSILKGGVVLQTIFVNGAVTAGTNTISSGSAMVFLTAGSQISIGLQANVPVTASGGTLEIAKMSN